MDRTAAALAPAHGRPHHRAAAWAFRSAHDAASGAGEREPAPAGAAEADRHHARRSGRRRHRRNAAEGRNPAPSGAAARASESGSGGAPDAIVLAADTVVAVGRRILPKAETEAQARREMHFRAAPRDDALLQINADTLHLDHGARRRAREHDAP